MIFISKVYLIICSVLGNAFRDLDVTKTCVGFDYCFPRIIWSHWDSDIIPDDVQEMLSISRNSLINFTFCFLSDQNISLFLDFDSFPKTFSTFTSLRKGDFFRIRLVEKYGGVWVDSSTYINSGQEMEWFFSEAIKSKLQIVSFIDNGWISPNFYGAMENSSLMKVIRNEYDIALNNDIEYINKTCPILLKNKIDSVSLLKNCNPHYLLDLTLKKVKFDELVLFDEKVLLLPASRSHYQVQFECRWSKHCYRKRLFNSNIRREIPFIKIFHRDRESIREGRVSLKKEKRQKQSKEKINVNHKKNKDLSDL